MIISLRCVGIDVSKAMLDIFDDAVGRPERIANAPQPIAEQVARWRSGDVFVVFEATGVYDRALAEALRQAGIRFARINPARARDFARAGGRRAKTDAIDARMLAAFARTMVPAAADRPPEPGRSTLAELAKRRDQLVHMRAQEKNRRSEAAGRAMIEGIVRHLDFLNSEIKAIEAAIKTLIKAEPEIGEQARLLRSAPGIGPVACMQLLVTNATTAAQICDLQQNNVADGGPGISGGTSYNFSFWAKSLGKNLSGGYVQQYKLTWLNSSGVIVGTVGFNNFTVGTGAWTQVANGPLVAPATAVNVLVEIRIATGGIVGLLVGILGGPLGVLIGGATGVLIGSLFDLDDADDTDSVLSEIAKSIGTGPAGLLAEVTEQSPEVVDTAMQGLGGTVLRRSVDDVEGIPTRTAASGAKRPVL